MPRPEAHDIRSRDGRLYSLYDATLSIADPFPEGVDNGESPEPTLDGFGHAYGSAFEHYATTELRYQTELSYNLLNYAISQAWDYRDTNAPIVRPIPTLRRLLALNPTCGCLLPTARMIWCAPMLPPAGWRSIFPWAAAVLACMFIPVGTCSTPARTAVQPLRAMFAPFWLPEPEGT